MHTTTRISLSKLFSGLIALATLAVAAPAFSQSPANDLTITVNELANGDVKFTASGTSRMLSSNSFYTTNANSSTMTPPQNRPSNLPQFIELPEGLIFTLPENMTWSRESTPKVAPPSSEFPLSYIFFTSGFWHMGSYYSGELQQGDPITGSGTIVVSKTVIPFTDFVPGTYQARKAPYSQDGDDLYDLTYKVIPYSVGLEVGTPAQFPDTQVNRSSAPQKITITNKGSLPVSGLKVQITKSGKKNFKVKQPALKSLEAGESTTFEATFKPSGDGTKTAQVTVTDGTSVKKVTLKGKGVESKVNSPRFPRRPGN